MAGSLPLHRERRHRPIRTDERFGGWAGTLFGWVGGGGGIGVGGTLGSLLGSTALAVTPSSELPPSTAP